WWSRNVSVRARVVLAALAGAPFRRSSPRRASRVTGGGGSCRGTAMPAGRLHTAVRAAASAARLAWADVDARPPTTPAAGPRLLPRAHERLADAGCAAVVVV